MTLSNVQIEQSKLDNLAMKVFAVSGEAPKHTVDEMVQILDYVAHHQVTPSGTLSISQNGQYDVTEYATADVNVGESNFIITLNYQQGDGYLPDKTFAEVMAARNDGKKIAVRVSDEDFADGLIADGKFNSVGDTFVYYVGIPTSIGGVTGFNVEIYVFNSGGVVLDDIYTYIYPTGTKTINASGNTDVTNYATANIPAGSATAPASISGTSATVSTGTNTLTLSKTVSVTPSVSAGYVSSGTAGNSAVSLTASVTTQAAQTIHPSSSDQTIASGRYLTGTQTIKAVTTTNLTAANIKSGVVVEVGDSTDSDCVTKITGTYSGGGSAKNIQVNSGSNSVRTNGYTSTGHSLTVAKTGTYKVSWTAWRSSSQGTMGTNLYRNSTAGTNQQTWTNTYGQHIVLNNQSYTAGDVLTLYATAGSTSRYCWVAGLTIEEQ